MMNVVGCLGGFLHSASQFVESKGLPIKAFLHVLQT
jgi:hypothetical protein